MKQAQEHYGSRKQAARMESMEFPDEEFGEREAEFIAERDSFYVASVGENGWPYVQFRGGPKGFLHLLRLADIGVCGFPWELAIYHHRQCSTR